jgi:ABC-2 type transport system permease protein
MAFAFNAMMGTSLFGAIAVAREYGHHTVIPMYLTSPNRTRAVVAQLLAVLSGGAVLALLGQALVVAGVAVALPSTGYGFLVSAGDVARLFAATTLAGAIGATLGAGLGTLIRNIGGAVTTAVLVLFLVPPLVVQLFSDTGSWIPTTLFAVISGVSPGVSLWAALLAIVMWALVPAAAGLIAVQRRDVA